jgi:nitrous oxidase accessory protein NosD
MRFTGKFAVCLTSALLGAALIPASFAAKAQAFTGTLSDAMCGAKHMMEGDDAACLRACVQKGSKYALVVGDKVYTLDTKDKATLEGQADGDTIEVSSVDAAK